MTLRGLFNFQLTKEGFTAPTKPILHMYDILGKHKKPS